jgi:hypothetical protein
MPGSGLPAATADQLKVCQSVVMPGVVNVVAVIGPGVGEAEDEVDSPAVGVGADVAVAEAVSETEAVVGAVSEGVPPAMSVFGASARGARTAATMITATAPAKASLSAALEWDPRGAWAGGVALSATASHSSRTSSLLWK